MASSSSLGGEVVASENIENPNIPVITPRNLLLCGVCHDYYNDPCLLSCYHTFCARCLREPQLDGKVSCPICGQTTQVKEGDHQPPSDQLMRQLIELANCENPPCANCEKRDKTTMFFCTTCGQALCTHCRENTHRAKMFSSHEVVHMSKCNKDTQRRCPIHGEQYVMFSQSGKFMLCATCFRETPAEVRLHCIDIDLAWQQASKKMEHAANSICELQAAVRDGLLDLKLQLDKLKYSFESEKQALNTYCQGIQETVNKTQSLVLLELHREFDTKDRMVRTQLLALGSALPVLQIHLGLYTAFTSATSKYQFLELAHPMLDRLGRVAQLGHLSKPPLLNSQLTSNYKNEFTRILQPFINGLTITPKDVLYDKIQSKQQHQQESHVIQQSEPTTKLQTLKSIYDSSRFNNHCRVFDNELQELSNQLTAVKERLGELHRDVTLLRRANIPPLGTRYENIAKDCRLLEQQLEHQQIELERLRTVFDILWEEQSCRIQLEKEIFYSQINNILSLKDEVKQLQLVAQQLDPIVKSFAVAENTGEIGAANSESIGHKQLQSLLDHLSRLKMEEPQHSQIPILTKEYHHQRNTTINDTVSCTKDSKEVPIRCKTPCNGIDTVLDSSRNIIVYGTKTDSKRGQLIEKTRIKDDRKKSSNEETRDRNQARRFRKSPENNKLKIASGHSSVSKFRSLYRTLKTGGYENDASIEVLDQQGDDYRLQQSARQGDECDYQRIFEASSAGEVKKRVQAQVHPIPSEILKDSEKVFYMTEKDSTEKRERQRRRASCESLSTIGSGSRRSSIADETLGLSAQDTRKTLVFLIGSSPMTSSLMQKQRSWETFPRHKSKRNSSISYGDTGGISDNRSGIGDGSSGGGSFNQLKKADSFEGHEEAVRTLVAAVQETRSQLRQQHFHQHRYHRKSKTN